MKNCVYDEKCVCDERGRTLPTRCPPDGHDGKLISLYIMTGVGSSFSKLQRVSSRACCDIHVVRATLFQYEACC